MKMLGGTEATPMESDPWPDLRSELVLAIDFVIV